MFGRDSHGRADGQVGQPPEAGGLTEPCPVHGREHFLYDVCGPCVHEVCLGSMLRFWEQTEDDGRIFRYGAEQVLSLRSWLCAYGLSLLGTDPLAPESWRRVLKAFQQYELKQRAREKMLPEVDLLMNRMAQARGNPHQGHFSVYPDSGLWVKECIAEIVRMTSVCEAAYLLDVISLNDLAKLEYEGNRMKASATVGALVKHLKEWMK